MLIYLIWLTTAKCRIRFARYQWQAVEKTIADVAWWFSFAPSELMVMNIDDVIMWQRQMTNQIKAKYSKI
ncbi:MAG: GpE family phage tail protein [Gammaproteobacteria bacterium]|nr:GpE family phage tail protein [Gammaproteobacteria bacterium]